MCADHEPSGSSFLNNISRGKGPLPVRLLKASFNLLRRGFPPSTCCGHYGEPGC